MGGSKVTSQALFLASVPIFDISDNCQILEYMLRDVGRLLSAEHLNQSKSCQRFILYETGLVRARSDLNHHAFANTRSVGAQLCKAV